MSAKWMIFASVLLSGVAQVLLKQGMTRVQARLGVQPGGVGRLVQFVVTDIFVWMWGFSFVIATSLWLLGLQKVDLSYAYPLVSFGYVLVSLLAMFCFSEKIDARRWTAIAVICVGVILIANS